MTGRPSDRPSWKSSAPAPGAVWTMPVPSSSPTSSQAHDDVLVRHLPIRGEGLADGRQVVVRAGVAPADEIRAEPLFLDREFADHRLLERAAPDPEAVVTLADAHVALLRVDGGGDVRGQRPWRRGPDEQRLTRPVDQREAHGQARVVALLVALVHLHLGEAGAAARAPRHRVVALVDPAAPVALREEAPDQVVVLVAEREVAAADLGHPEPPDEHLDGVGDRTVLALGRRGLRRVRGEQVAQAAQLVGVVPGHPHPEPDRLLGLARRIRQDALFAQVHEFVDAERFDVALARESELTFDVDLDPQSLAIEAVLPALVVAEHRAKSLEDVLVGAAPGVVHAHRIVRGDGPVEEAPPFATGVLGLQPGERPPLRPQVQHVVFELDQVGSGADRTEHHTSFNRRSPRASDGVRRCAHGASNGPSILPAMPSVQEGRPRTRSSFAAAVLSLIFPGLGHAYAGAWNRALLFATPPTLLIALVAGIALRVDRYELVGFMLQPWVLWAILLVNVVMLIYRAVAIVDAWRVTQYLNQVDLVRAQPDRRPRRSAWAPISAAGLLAVVLVMSGVHVAVAYYDMQAQQVTCIFDAETATCDPEATPTPGPSASSEPSAVGSERPDPTERPTPTIAVGTADPSVTPPPLATILPPTPTERVNILLIGADERPQFDTYNTDTLIVVSIDPTTGSAAMFSLPRDTVDVPMAAGPWQRVFGSSYGGKINSLWTAATLRKDLFPGNDAQRGFAAIKSTLSELYDIDIKYYVSVNFEGFREIVDALGGVTINVQLPVTDDKYPGDDGRLRRVYIPTGIQHMDGAQALIYARSRNSSNDFDRAQRQQRVLLSLRQQADVGSLIEKLPQLVKALRNAVHTDMPIELLPGLLRLAGDIDTQKIRSYVFAPPRLRPGLRERPDRPRPRLRDHPQRLPDPRHGRQRVRPRSQARGAPREGRRRARGRVGRLGHGRCDRRRRARRLPRAGGHGRERTAPGRRVRAPGDQDRGLQRRGGGRPEHDRDARADLRRHGRAGRRPQGARPDHRHDGAGHPAADAGTGRLSATAARVPPRPASAARLSRPASPSGCTPARAPRTMSK